MHPTSFDKMAGFGREYLGGRTNERLVILDIGSQDINGSYRPRFSEPGCIYGGVNMATGNNVDVVLRNPYCWRKIRAGTADVARIEVLQATTQGEDLPQYDDASNKWHDSMLVARKQHESLRVRATQALHSWISQKLPNREMVLTG